MLARRALQKARSNPRGEVQLRFRNTSSSSEAAWALPRATFLKKKLCTECGASFGHSTHSLSMGTADRGQGGQMRPPLCLSGYAAFLAAFLTAAQRFFEAAIIRCRPSSLMTRFLATFLTAFVDITVFGDSTAAESPSSNSRNTAMALSIAPFCCSSLAMISLKLSNNRSIFGACEKLPFLA
jgi:hypothetical protein